MNDASVRPGRQMAAAWAALSAAAAAPALAFLAAAYHKRPSLTGTLAWWLALVLTGFAFSVLVGLLERRRPAWPAGVGFLLVFANWQDLRGIVIPAADPSIDAALGLLIAAAVGMAMFRLLASQSARLILLVVLGVSVLVGLVNVVSVVVGTRPLVFDQPTVDLDPVQRKPDVYLIVADGYGRADVLATEYRYDNQPFVEALAKRGLETRDDATTEYSMTYASLASTLAMDHLVEPGDALGKADRVSLYQVLGGENRVVDAFSQFGYDYVHYESGWGGTRCGHMVDECLHSRWEESTWALVQRTPLGPLATTVLGSAFSRASVSQLQRAIDDAPREGEIPRFTLLHSLIPHAPLHVKDDCSIDGRPELGALNIYAPWILGASLETRKAAYIEQLECFNRMVLELIDALPADTVIVLISDHGPDSHGQLTTRTTEWGEEDVYERMSTLTAIRLPGPCRQLDEAYGVDIFTVVLNCLFDAHLPLHPDRRIIVNVEENFPADPVIEWAG